MNSHEEVVVQQHAAEEGLRSSSVQFTAVVTLQHGRDTISTQDYFGDATFVVKFTDNAALKLDVEKCCACEQTINMKHPMEHSTRDVRNADNVTVKSETAFSSCSAMEDDSADAGVVKEVVRDLVNYVVYEASSFPENLVL